MPEPKTTIALETLPDVWKGLSRAAQAETVLFLNQKAGMKQAEIAATLGIKPRRVKSRMDDAKSYVLNGTIPTGELDIQVDEQSDVIETEMDRRDRLVLNRQARTDISNIVTARGILDEIQALLNDVTRRTEIEAHIGRMKSVSLERGKVRSEKASGTEEAIQLVSDLHHCRFLPGVIDEETTGRALARYGNTSADLLYRQQAHTHVDTLNLFFNGDIAHGLANYKAQSREVTGTWSQQIFRTAWLLIQYVNGRRTEYKRVNVVFTGGNHGKKSQQDDLMTENAEFEIGHIVQAYFANVEDVDVVVAMDNFWHIADILGRRILVTHGDAINGAGNPQVIVDACKRWEAVLPPFDDVLMGHWHRIMDMPLPRKYGSMIGRAVFVNGTASLEDKFLETFGSSPSLQWWLLFTNGKRITSQYKVDLYRETSEVAA